MRVAQDFKRLAGATMRFGFGLAKRLLVILPAVATVVWTANAGPADAVEIRLKSAAPDRLERQRLAATGQLPLPGTPDLARRDERLAKKGLRLGQPIILRIFKSEAEAEVWMERDGRFIHFATYPICHWSGALGPKLKEGDKQSPEGFYTVTKRRLHRSGRWPRSLNLGFPNALDRSLERTGSYLLIHGGCSSVGCFAMTNPVMEEIYDLTTAALKGGQKHIPVHIFPFHMTQANLAKHENSKWIDFWRGLKPGYDAFNQERMAPIVSVCKGDYQVDRFSANAELAASRIGAPLQVCPKTAALLNAFDRLDRIAQRPSRYRRLSKQARKRLRDMVGQKRIARALKGRGPSKTAQNSHIRRGINRRTKKRVACDSRKPSCRRHLALKRRAASRRTAQRRPRATSTRVSRR
ncbi:MAG: murein L,D-transpeptidase family protein [Pseudomonadota bacterium]